MTYIANIQPSPSACAHTTRLHILLCKIPQGTVHCTTPTPQHVRGLSSLTGHQRMLCARRELTVTAAAPPRA